MYRKWSSILAIKLTSSLFSFSQVIPSLNPPLSSSQIALFKNTIKTSPLSHPLWRRSFNVAAQRSDFLSDSDSNWSGKQNPHGFDRENSTNLLTHGHADQNLGANEDGTYRKRSDFLMYSNPNGSYNQNPYGSDRTKSSNMQKTPFGCANGQFNQMNTVWKLGANEDGVHRERSDFSLYSDPKGSYKENPYGSDRKDSTNLQQNPVRYPNGEFNLTNNDRNLGAGEDGIYRERSDLSTHPNPNGYYQHNQFGKGTANLRQVPIGYPDNQRLEENEDGINGKRLDFSMYSNPSEPCQHNQLGKSSNHLKQNAIGYSNIPVQNSVSEFQRDGHKIGGQFNQMGQNLGVDGDGVYRKRLHFSHHSDHNGLYDRDQYGWNSANLQQNPIGHPNCQFNQTISGQNSWANEDGICRERSDFPRHSYPNGSYLGKQYGMNSTNLQQNLNGYQRSNLEEAQQWNSNGVYRENRNEYGIGDHFNQTNNGQNFGSKKDGIYRKPSDFSPYSDPDVSYHHSQAGRCLSNLQPNQVRYPNFPIQSGEEEFQRNGSRTVGQFSPLNNSHGKNSGSNEEKIYYKRSEFLPSSDPEWSYHQKQSINYTSLQQSPNGYQRNSVGEAQQWNSNGLFREKPNGYGIGNRFNQTKSELELRSKADGAYNDYPYENESSFFRGNNKELNQDPDEPCEVNPEEFYHQKSYGYEKGNPISNELQNLKDSPLISSEIITYEDTVYKFDELCKEGKIKEAIAILAVLEKIGMAIDLPRYLLLMQACGKEKCLEKARLVHDHLEWTLGELELRVHNKILSMYSSCGSMDDAYSFFEKMPQRNLTSWETMIRGLANHGLGEEAIDLFTQFKEMGLKPDEGLFAAVFYTCGVLGAVDQGMMYFDSMKVDYGISPVMEHYISIVDMLGRSGHLDEALEFIEMMPIEPNVDVWETLMNFCRVNGYTEIGDRCAEIVEQHDSTRLKEQSKKGLLPIETLEMIKENDRKQDSDGFNAKHCMHEFMAGRPENYMLYQQLRCLAQQMKEAGYVPDIACALHDVDPENREEALMYHSERLAIIHACMTSPPRRLVRVIKNLRVCRDCHVFMKIVSKLTGRLIVARDTKRFHHVENGICSCNDFW